MNARALCFPNVLKTQEELEASNSLLDLKIINKNLARTYNHYKLDEFTFSKFLKDICVEIEEIPSSDIKFLFNNMNKKSFPIENIYEGLNADDFWYRSNFGHEKCDNMREWIAQTSENIFFYNRKLFSFNRKKYIQIAFVDYEIENTLGQLLNLSSFLEDELITSQTNFYHSKISFDTDDYDINDFVIHKNLEIKENKTVYVVDYLDEYQKYLTNKNMNIFNIPANKRKFYNNRQSIRTETYRFRDLISQIYSKTTEFLRKGIHDYDFISFMYIEVPENIYHKKNSQFEILNKLPIL